MTDIATCAERAQAVPRDVAVKRPAQVVTLHTTSLEAKRVPNSDRQAVRGGLSGAQVYRLILLILLASGFTGYLLSMLSQHT
jgi:hypothetical protein